MLAKLLCCFLVIQLSTFHTFVCRSLVTQYVNAFPQRVKESIDLIHYIWNISLQKSQMEEDEMYQH